MKKLCVLLLSLAMTFSFAITASATNPHFKDVPTTHWAYENIEALAQGGLVGGYGNGYFGPDHTLNIDHMAQIICNAKGYYADSGSSYWAYDEVKYCIEKLYCLPKMGEVTSANYAVPCSRELAVYMMTKALGSSGKVQADYSITAKDIPDYARINPNYAPTILKAYQLGLISGVDDNRTFNPKANLTRAQACTVLNRAGFTKSAVKPTGTGTGMTADQMYDEMVSWGIWDINPDAGNGAKILTATDPKYGGISVKFNARGAVVISMYEKNTSGMHSSDGQNYVDVNGNVLSQETIMNGFRDANNKVVVSSGWSYDARQLVKRILKPAMPTANEEAYNAILSMMKQEVYEISNQNLPSVIRWLDGRTFKATLNGSSCVMTVSIGKTGDEASYTSVLAGSAVGTQGKYTSIFGGQDVSAFYELSRG